MSKRDRLSNWRIIQRASCLYLEFSGLAVVDAVAASLSIEAGVISIGEIRNVLGNQKKKRAQESHSARLDQLFRERHWPRVIDFSEMKEVLDKLHIEWRGSFNRNEFLF